ncbi:MAG: polyprenol monophosphomannose synthase [Deltaproteobacteria bacterium]|nr:MAG: polyprenol monophosphomannose synthase [Deltaproteobacteria bacterium]
MKTLIILPTYNEAGNIEPLIQQILGRTEGTEIVVVDDNSPDETGRIVEEIAAGEPRVHLLRRPEKLGLGTAYIAGFRFGLDRDFDAFVTMDADFSHDPRFLPPLIAGIEAYDIMIGSRYIPGGGIANWELYRRLLSRGANLFARMMLALQTRDCTSGMRCYRREVIESLDLSSIRSNGYSFLEEILYRCVQAGYRVGETPILFTDRRVGQSKISRGEIWRAIVTIFRLRFGRGGGKIRE